MEYEFIVNPDTNRKCRADSALGRRIIKNYVQMGGAPIVRNSLGHVEHSWKNWDDGGWRFEAWINHYEAQEGENAYRRTPPPYDNDPDHFSNEHWRALWAMAVKEKTAREKKQAAKKYRKEKNQRAKAKRERRDAAEIAAAKRKVAGIDEGKDKDENNKTIGRR